MTGLPRVLSLPPRNDYVDPLHGHAATLVARDEPWPRLPNLHDPAWVVANSGGWDLAHFHFTWEQYSPAHFRSVLDAHHASRTPVVWTAHDLRNPHTSSAATDRPYLELLADRADQVLTLTAGAAAEVATRFGRVARVVGHPPVLADDEITRYRALREHRSGRDRGGQSRAGRGGLRVFLLAKSLRTNLDWRTPLEVVRGWDVDDPPVTLDLHLHAGHGASELVREHLTPHGRVEVTVGSRLSRDDLCRRIGAADVLLLPYAWGTHSGMLELATDIGVPVVTTDVGHYADQAPCHLVGVDAGRLRRDELHATLRRLAGGVPTTGPVAPRARAEQRARFRHQHREVYRVCLDGTAAA